MADNLVHAQYGNDGVQIQAPQQIFPPGVAGVGQSAISNGSTDRLCPFIFAAPTSVDGAFTGTHRCMLTAPGTGVISVAPFAISMDTGATMTIDGCSIAVSDRNDLSKTVPYNAGTAYNSNSTGDVQKGFTALTWNGGSASITLPIVSGADLFEVAVGDELPITELARVDDSSKYPLFIVQQYFNARTISVIAWSTAADVDNLATEMAPYEFYQVAQAAVDGVTTPSNFTSVWTPGANTQKTRIFGLMFRFRNGSRGFVFCGESTQRGSAAAGSLTVNVSANVTKGWAIQAIRALASKTSPVGYANFSISGKNSTNYLARIKLIIPVLQPSDVCYLPYTTNDAPTTQAVILDEMTRTVDAVSFLKSWGSVTWLINAMPQNRPLALRLKMNQTIVGWSKSLCSFIDVNTPVYDATNAGNNYWKAGLNFDPDHANLAGCTIQGAYAASQIKTALGR